MIDPDKLTIAELETAAGPAETWAGRCHEVSCDALKLIDGRVLRGWLKGSMVGQHSWVELPDGRVFDATRHQFFDRDKPEIWIGPPGDYDVGGCDVQEPMGRMPTRADSRNPAEILIPIADREIRIMMEMSGVDPDEPLTYDQVSWLAHLPVKAHVGLGQMNAEQAREVYGAIVAAGHRALIPIDRHHWILGDVEGYEGKEWVDARS